VRFLNEIGWSNWSTVDTPTEMTTVPHKPTDPPARIEQLTFGSQMAISFGELTGDATGG
jgi:hypothetical protein